VALLGEVGAVAEEVTPVEVRFSREVSTGRAVSRSLAILLATAVFTLQGSVMAAAGPAAAVSYLLVGVVVLLTLLCYVELLTSGGREGGAYVLLSDATRGPIAFLTGWAVLLGALLLCALLALGFAASVSTICEVYLGVHLSEPLLAALLTLAMAIYNVLGGWSHRRARDIVARVAFAALLLLCLLCLPRVQLANYRPFSPRGYLGIQSGLSLLLIGFLALESVPLTVSEIRQPRRAIPRALFLTMGLGTLLFVAVVLVAGGVLNAATLGQSGLPLVAMAGVCLGGYGQLAMLTLTAIFIPLAMNSALLSVVRQAQVMDRDGALPELLRRRATRWQTPYVLLVLTGVAAALLCLTGDLELVARIGGFCVLFVMSMVAVGDAVRERDEEQVPGFRLPLRPLVPALALVVNVFLMPVMGTVSVAVGAVWLLIGLGIYFAYARAKLIEGQEGVLVFRTKREPSEAKYRVLVPVGPSERPSQLIKLAVGLAGGEGGEVLALRVLTLPAQVPLHEGARMAEGVESLFSWSLESEDTGPVTLMPVTRVARSVSQGIIDTAAEERCDLILLNWEGYTETKGRIMGQVLDPVVENAPCDVVLVKGEKLSTPQTILLPTSGGPHASIAAQIAVKLARLSGGQVTVMYVCREGATAMERQHAEDMIARTIKGLPIDDLVRTKVVTAPGIVSGILSEAQEYDLMMLGASEEGLFDRVLFGTIPERIAQKSPVPVMIAKQRAPLPQFWLRRVWNTAYSLLPTLEAEERSTVYREIREGARSDIDFFVMITLSATIATLGLLLDSAAVIIGGMLVAPLMSPIIGIALSIALGNVRLLRDAAESTIKGVFLAIVVGLFVAAVSPLSTVTGEILARTRPNLLDLVVALASGAAGAYAMSRKGVSAALPGVAIAAALVPPLEVVGIGLAINRADVTGGGLLLFVTNLVAITFAGAMIFLFLGFRPARGGRERETQVRRGLVISVLLLFIVSLPLALIFGRAVQTSQQREVIDRVLSEELDQLDQVSLVGFELDYQGETIVLTATVYAAEEIDETTVQQLDDVVTQGVGQPVTLHLIAIPVSRMVAP
jgi:APA family basic amino acid/polyamine antiporter